MALALTIRGKLFGLSLLGLALVLGAGGVGTVAVGRLQAANAQVLQAGNAVKAQMQADMMHDALRGDVLRAQLAALRDDFKEMGAGIKVDIRELFAKFAAQSDRGA